MTERERGGAPRVVEASSARELLGIRVACVPCHIANGQFHLDLAQAGLNLRETSRSLTATILAQFISYDLGALEHDAVATSHISAAYGP